MSVKPLEPRPTHPPPWLFMFTCIPYGAAGTFTGTVMPVVARDAKIELDTIGWFTALLFVPTWLQFLYAPVVDLFTGRRNWLVILAFAAAGCYMGACMMPLPGATTPFLVLAFTGQLLTGLIGACNGGLMASTLPDEVRGRAGALYNIGNLSGGALAGWVVILLMDEVEAVWVGLILAAMIIAPALFVLKVVEPPRVRESAGAVFRSMIRGVGGVFFSKKGITGILLCLSPVGTAALLNTFSALAQDYAVSKGWLAFVTGPATAVVSAVGAFVGGVMCDRYNRRAMYLLSGVLTGITGLAMASCPESQTTFITFVILYNLVAGLCYTAFTATVLETIGNADAAASTKYTLFTASGNAAISYVVVVNTRFHNPQKIGDIEVGGPSAVVAVDALMNLGGVVVLALLFWYLGFFKRKEFQSVSDRTQT